MYEEEKECPYFYLYHHMLRVRNKTASQLKNNKRNIDVGKANDN